MAHYKKSKLSGSVAGPVIQAATERTYFEDGLMIRNQSFGKKQPSKSPHYI